MKLQLIKILTAILILASSSGHAQLNKSYFFNQGRHLLSQEKFPEAIAMLNQLLRADSTIAEAWFIRGVAKYYLNDLHGAHSDFSAALRQNPVFSQAFLYRAITSSRMSKFTQAIPDFDAAIDLRPNSPDAYYSRGVAYLIMRNPEKSIMDLSQSILLDPKNPDTWINRGTARLLLQDTTGAFADYLQAIGLNPFYAESYGKRGRLFLEMKKYEQALADLNQAVKLDTTSTIHMFLLAIAHSEMGERKNAIGKLTEVLRRNPNNALSLYNRALLHWQEGETRKALADFDEAATQNPDNVLIYYNRGVLLMELDKTHEAIDDFTHTIKLFPDFAKAYIGRSIAYKRLGRNLEGHRDYVYAQSIAARFSQGQQHPWSDTTKRFDNLIAFSSDFSTKATISAIDEYNAKPIDILPFMRAIAIPRERLLLQSQSVDELNRINSNLKGSGFRLVLSTPKEYQVTPIEYSDTLPPFETVLFQAMNLSSQGRFNQAIDEYYKALAIDPNSIVTLINLAIEKAEMARFIASFDQEVNYVRMEQQTRAQRANDQKSTSFFIPFDDSHYLLENAGYLLPNQPALYYNRANLFALAGQMAEAVKYYTKVTELDETFAEAWYNRGLVRLMQRDTDQGCRDMGKAGEHGIKQSYLIIHRFCR